MPSHPVNSEIGAAFGKFFYSGWGPSHSTLTRAFQASGYADADPYDPALGAPNKEQRVLTVFRSAERRPAQARRLVEELLTALRIHGSLDEQPSSEQPQEAVRVLRRALQHRGWDLANEGRLVQLGDIDLSTGGREALDEQLDRLRRNQEDPAALLGGAKDLLESIAKFVLQETAMLPDRKMDYPEVLTLAFDRLDLMPKGVDSSMPGATQVKSIYQAARTTTVAINELRNLQGTGHGRTLPTGVTVEAARYVIREAAHVAELMLSTLDRQISTGRA
jgi:hypothetical protein